MATDNKRTARTAFDRPGVPVIISSIAKKSNLSDEFESRFTTMSNTPDDDDGDVELLAVTREEAHRTIENQIRTLNDIDSKAARLLRLNLVLLSILLSGLSLTIGPGKGSPMTASLSRVLNAYTLAGLVLLLLSTGVAGVTYTASHLKIGMSPDDLRSILNNDYSDRRNVEGLVESYASWIQQNYVVNAKNAPLGTLTILFLLYAMAAFALGVKQAITGQVAWWLSVGALLLLIGVTYATGFFGQVARYRAVRNH